ncbi:hypothetical protein [Limnohabitans sp.]|uniref:hypothetical protein n=1 Tax=Limnohabitans sp. TaxID=1907725 RepID=UPI00286ED794|nr:hypothetical protein [Limnohabitans sp.]
MDSPLFFFFRGVVGLSVCLSVVAAGALSAESQRIYRCGNAYTNQPDLTLNCKPLTGGHVTVIEGTRVQGPQAPLPNASAGAASIKVDAADQRQRDAQAQALLQAELQKTQKLQADLLREWNNGEPERRADEFRQSQKYQDRVTQLRAALQRAEADVAGLQRELSRLSVPVQTGAKP